MSRDPKESEEKIEISRAELHGPIILGGKNLGTMNNKLTASNGVRMHYCRVHHELHIHCNGDDGIIPSANIALLVPVKHKAKVEAVNSNPIRTIVDTSKVQVGTPGGPVKAQVETPQDHVFAGPGHGKTK